MAGLRSSLAAVRAVTAAIRPALTRFYEALDQGQKVRFAGMSRGAACQMLPTIALAFRLTGCYLFCRTE
jgi:hypothetical protein